MKKKRKVNEFEFVLYIIFGIACLMPQAINEFLPEEWGWKVRIILLILFSFIILFWRGIDKLLLNKNDKHRKIKRK